MDGDLSWCGVPRDSHIMADVVELHIELVDARNEFGAIKTGAITLRAQPLRPQKCLDSGRFTRISVDVPIDDAYATTYLDSQAPTDDALSEMILLPIARIVYEDDFQFKIAGLLLKPHDTQFQRIGFWTANDERLEYCFESSKEREITII